MPSRLRRPLGVAWAAGVLVATAAAPASAVPDCQTPLPTAVPILTGQGSLESVIVDRRGRLFYTDTTRKALMRLDAPGARPVVVRDGIDGPGGLAFDGDGTHLFVGQGDSVGGGVQGNLQPVASLLRIDVDTGETATFASGLRMANGVVRASSDGKIYASTDIGLNLDLIEPDGSVLPNWATIPSANGLALDRDETHLFAAQTFVPAAITRVDRARPTVTEQIFRATGADLVAGLDGMVMDVRERLIVAANALGEVWRVASDGSGAACALGRGLMNTSAVAYGRGSTGFSAGRLFAVGFDGKVVEVPGGRLDVPAPTPEPGEARVTLEPASVRVARNGRVRLIPHVRRGTRLVKATLKVGRRTLRTGHPAILVVKDRQKQLTVRFTLGGASYTRAVALRR